MSLKPLNIILTGAASGLGRGLAQHFAAQGHRLLLADRNAEGLRETMALLGAAADRATTHTLDVTSGAQVRDLFASIGGQRIDLLVNDAGVQYVARLEEFPEDRWD